VVLLPWQQDQQTVLIKKKDNLLPSLFFFAGDLNSASRSFPDETSTWYGGALFEFLQLGYKSAYHSFENWGDRDPKKMVSFTMENALYDYIFYKSSDILLSVSSCEELPQLCGRLCANYPKLSDHDPIFVAFTYH